MKVILKFSKKKKTQQNKKPTTKFGGFDTHWPVTASYCSLPFISLGRFNRYLGKVGSNGFLRFWIYAWPTGLFYLVHTTDAGRPPSPFTLTQVSSEKNCNASVSMRAFYYCLRKLRWFCFSNQINIQADKVTGHRSCLTKSFPW